MTFKEEYKAFDRAIRSDIYCQFNWSEFDEAVMMTGVSITVFEAWWRAHDALMKVDKLAQKVTAAQWEMNKQLGWDDIPF